MALPEVYIPSFYNAMQQGRADKRTAMLNALQDEFMISSKKRAEEEGAMLNEQKKAQITYSILSLPKTSGIKSKYAITRCIQRICT